MGKSKNEKWNFIFTRRIEEVLKMKQKVSLWLGNFASQEEFQEYFKISNKEDGDSISSEFETDFHLSYYDRDLVEKDWVDVSENNIDVLLEGFSYDEEIIMQFPKISTTYNTIVLIYDFDYSKEGLKVSNNGSGTLEFIGIAEYDY